jgi:hypothetical protein
MSGSPPFTENSPWPEPAVDPVPPPACPICFLSPSEQDEMMRLTEHKGARCTAGQCIVLGIAYPVNRDGYPLRTLWPWYDHDDERPR